ncbi:hypothetical protein DRI50_05295 [candidate division KSB1 bacterium]|nr:MAG: hypothetical protein DRI50_05295 [candidate division KSB1 bacterium]
MISCDTAKSMLSDYMEHTLSPDERSSVEEHLSQCLECKRVFDDVAFLTQKLRTLPSIQPSENFDGQLRLRIAGNYSQASHPVVSRKGFTFGLSGAALIAVITFFVLTTNSPEPQPLIQPASNQVINRANQIASPIAHSKELQSASTAKLANSNDSLTEQPQKVNQNNIKLVDQVKN